MKQNKKERKAFLLRRIFLLLIILLTITLVVGAFYIINTIPNYCESGCYKECGCRIISNCTMSIESQAYSANSNLQEDIIWLK